MGPVTSPFLSGEIVAGKYRIERQIGAGGMGVVLAATHLELLEPRALKFLSPEALTDAESVERFLREARAASRLKSEHVAQVHDVGRLPNGTPFLVMEYLEGSDLGAVLKQTTRLPANVAIDYLLQAMEALAEAHAHGIVHRDLKPANLFLTFRSDGTHCVKVLDFGISKIKDPGGEEMDVTKTHAVLGSPHYMSPEQMESSRDVDARSDIWALGVILYQLIAGELPFKGKKMTEVVAVVFSRPPTPPSQIVPGLPLELEATILRCLQHDLSMRPQNVGELARALAPFAGPHSAHSVDRITRLVQAPVALRSSSSTNTAVVRGRDPVSITPMPVVAPISIPAPNPLASSSTGNKLITPVGGFSERMNDETLAQPGSAPGAWGATAAGTKRRFPMAIVLLAVGALLTGVAIVVGILTSRSSSESVEASAASAVVAMQSAAPVAFAVESNTTAAVESAEPAMPSVTVSATSSPRSTKRTKASPAPTADPFGMDRK